MVTILEQPDRQVDDSASSRRLGVLPWCLLAAACLYLYMPVLSHLIADWWDDPDYSHGFLVPLLSAYFVWERRQKLFDTMPRSSRWGAGVLLAGLALFFLGHVGAELFLMRFSLVVVITGLVVYLLGQKHMKILAFPVAFLLFMIPPPAIILNAITFPLQLLAAKLSTFSLQLLSLPVYREGNIIFLPHIALEIVEACSGLRSLMSLTALAVVFAYFTQRSTWKLVTLVVSAVPIALVANAFRIWGTGVAVNLWSAKLAEGFYHTFAGWSVFVVAFGLLLLEGLVLSRLGFGGAYFEGRAA